MFLAPGTSILLPFFHLQSTCHHRQWDVIIILRDVEAFIIIQSLLFETRTIKDRVDPSESGRSQNNCFVQNVNARMHEY